ncbi:MAG: hypothetical protein IT427_15105 [Pirellulales bacterium]|nr:hypothetical protein [Pirellulales bacterium]
MSRLACVQKTGKKQWQACCPAHEDNRASLSVACLNGDGKIGVHCHAGCATADVLGAIGLKMADLMPSPSKRNGTNNHRPKIVATYDYRSQVGELLFQVVRFDPKDFRQRKPKPGGGWDWSVKGVRVVPYRLPELAAADAAAAVLVLEGEKDVDYLHSFGLVATCNAGGAGKWRREHAEYLCGKNVVILPDNDLPGRQHAEQVASSLVGIAASLKIVSLPGLPEKGDVSDWLDNGGTDVELLRLVEAEDQWTPSRKTDNGHNPTHDSIEPRRTTDVGNAERFAAQHGADVRYCHAWRKWLVWDGRRWGIDQSGEIMRRAKQTARSIYVEASQATDRHEREALAKWAAASERRERLAAMAALAESEQPVPVAVESLDAEPWLLNCQNGTLNLRTGELLPHRQKHYLTKICPVEYPAGCDSDPKLWLGFLDRIFAGNKELIEFLRRLVGMALVGEVVENILPIFYGSGANGKSVFIETVCGMFGSDYAISATTSLLMVDQQSRHPTEKTDLFGRRLVATIETGDGGRLSEETVKQLTSREAIRARRMREDFWEFKPSHTILVATNHKPTVRGTDYGIWRRLRLVPFAVTIPENERDPELAHKLRNEWPSILRWAVGGCLEWQRHGLQAPDVVVEATDNYRAESDVLGEFLEERCVIGDQFTAAAGDMYHAYTQWCEARGEFKQTQTKFGARLAERGFTKRRGADGRKVYLGVGLLP